jgi:hypothetical protein
MKFFRLVLSLLLCFLSAGSLLAAPRSETDALMVARQFYSGLNNTLVRSSLDLKLAYTCRDTASRLRSSEQPALFYIFHVGENQGFVIVSGEEATKSVLGYSEEGAIPSSSTSSCFWGWLEHFRKEIQYARENNLVCAEKEETYAAPVAPLLGNIQWDQDAPYNLLCPYDTTEKKHTLTGCVATATAQVMKYHCWPIKGMGSKRYNDFLYDTISADFGNTYYDWANMPDTGRFLTGRQDTAIATLMFHCGVAVEMNYGVESSGANLGHSGLALVRYFGYDSDVQLYSRQFFSGEQWENIILSELDASRPIIISGFDDELGHAFVCDGYDQNGLLHINWGWSGDYNGYFELSALGIDTLNFSESQKILVGIQKPDDETHLHFQVGMYSRSLGSSVPALSSIDDQTFNLTLGYSNYGLNDFSGKYGIGLYQDNVLQKVLYEKPLESLKYLYGVMKDTVFNLSLSDLHSGKYQLICLYQPADSVSWSRIRSTDVWKNSLDVTVSGSMAMFVQPGESPLPADSAGRGWTIRRNPAGDMLTLTSNEPILEMSIYDLSGRLMLKAENSPMMLTDRLRKGLYLLRVKTSKGTACERFIKE